MMIHFAGRGFRSADWLCGAGTATMFTPRPAWLPSEPGPGTRIVVLGEADHAE